MQWIAIELQRKPRNVGSRHNEIPGPTKRWILDWGVGYRVHKLEFFAITRRGVKPHMLCGSERIGAPLSDAPPRIEVAGSER